jgi:hypothetical protein
VTQKQANAMVVSHSNYGGVQLVIIGLVGVPKK